MIFGIGFACLSGVMMVIMIVCAAHIRSENDEITNCTYLVYPSTSKTTFDYTVILNGSPCHSTSCYQFCPVNGTSCLGDNVNIDNLCTFGTTISTGYILLTITFGLAMIGFAIAAYVTLRRSCTDSGYSIL